MCLLSAVYMWSIILFITYCIIQYQLQRLISVKWDEKMAVYGEWKWTSKAATMDNFKVLFQYSLGRDW
jgi:hypothetical protein